MVLIPYSPELPLTASYKTPTLLLSITIICRISQPLKCRAIETIQDYNRPAANVIIPIIIAVMLSLSVTILM